RVLGPRVGYAGVEKADRFIIFTRAVGQLAAGEHALARLGITPDRDAVVLLPALTAEHEWQEHAAAVARHVLLAVQGEVARSFGFEGAVDGVASADELVQPESEDG